MDIIKLNDFYQTVLKRPMQITQIEAIKSQIAFQGNQMASEASNGFTMLGKGAPEIGLSTFRLFRPKILKPVPLDAERRPARLLKVKSRGILQPCF